MKVSIDGIELFTISDTKKRVICNEIPNNLFEEDMKRRIEYIIRHKYEQCFRRLKDEWDLKLAANGVHSVPTDPDSYAQLVFSQSDYKCRSTRDEEQTK